MPARVSGRVRWAEIVHAHVHPRADGTIRGGACRGGVELTVVEVVPYV